MSQNAESAASQDLSKAEVVALGDAHAPLVAEFFREMWDADASAESVLRARAQAAAENLNCPGEPPPSFLFLCDNRAIGYVSSIPVRIWNGAAERSGYWVKGLAVLKEFRNGPIGYLLLKEIIGQLPCALALTVTLPSRRLFEALGFSNLGVVGNYIRVLRARNVLRRIKLGELGLGRLPRWTAAGLGLAQSTGLAAVAGATLDTVMPLWIALRRGRIGTWTVEHDRPGVAPSELDSLWQEARASLGGAVVRNSSYLLPRYELGKDAAAYQPVVVRRGGLLRALAVVRQPREQADPRLQGLRVASLSDLLFPPGEPSAALAALAGAEAVARSWQADALIASASHPSLLAVLPRHGYMAIPGNMHFLVRDAAASEGVLPAQLAAWYVTRGDSFADEVF